MNDSVAVAEQTIKAHPMLHGNPLPMWIYDRKTLRFLDVSEGALREYGYTRAEFLGMTIRQLYPPQADPAAKPQSGQVEEINGVPLRLHKRKDGSLFPVTVYSNALVYEGRVARLVVVENAEFRSRLTGGPGSNSQLDSMTGLPRRSLLERRAQEAFEHAKRSKRRVAVVCLDLDRMEEVEERLGSEACDACLKQVANWLTRRVRGMDTVGRTGVKSFMIVLAELDNDFDLYRVAEALLKVFAEPVQVEDVSISLTASIGIAVYPDDGVDFLRLSRASASAMHKARLSGGHRIAMFSLELSERTELDAYMREMMKLGGFCLHYQPQYSPEGEIRIFEALLRLPAKEGGFIPADTFIPIAEETRMIEPLGLWVIGAVARQMKAWQDQYASTIRVAVNVSPVQLQGESFVTEALSAIRLAGGEPASIEFEITERAVLDFDQVAEPMRQLAQAGVVFAVDDFGTGYSSLQHLHRLPISVLKIDRSFVQRMAVPRGSEAIVEAIVSMAHSLGMQVVAEGVETQEQRDAATRIGCDLIQGFLHTSAISADEVPRLMGWKKKD
jgi:diguanylate cyclase (GGDEF)-like protein/PAS domain S-box-containing protein